MWDLVPWSEIKPGPPALGAWSLSHWTTREVHSLTICLHTHQVHPCLRASANTAPLSIMSWSLFPLTWSGRWQRPHTGALPQTHGILAQVLRSDSSQDSLHWGPLSKFLSYKLRRRQWHPTPVLLPGKSHGWRSLVGCSPWGRWGSDTTERLHFHFSLSCIGEGNGNPLQCSCLENPRDGEPGRLPSMGSHRVGHDWSDLAATEAAYSLWEGNYYSQFTD